MSLIAGRRLRDQAAEPRDQLLGVDGLDEVVVGPDQQADDAIRGLAPLAADEHDRQVLAEPLPQLAADLVARRPGKNRLEDDGGR